MYVLLPMSNLIVKLSSMSFLFINMWFLEYIHYRRGVLPHNLSQLPTPVQV